MAPRKLSELAAKARRDDYELDPEDGGPVVAIAQPTIGQWRRAVAAPTSEEFSTILGVPAADAARVGKVISDESLLGTEGEFVVDIRRHFGLGN